MSNESDIRRSELQGSRSSETVHDHLVSAILAINNERAVTGLNAKARSLLQLQDHQPGHQPLGTLPRPLIDLIEEGLRTGQAIQDKVVSLTWMNGSEAAMAVSIMPVLDSNGQASGLVVMLNDVGSIARLEEHMRRLDFLASIGTLAANMAHEIKNALVGVKTFLDLLVSQNKDADLASIVSREIKRIDVIVSQMLRVADPAKPTFSTLHLHEVMEHSLRLVEHQLAARKVRLKKSLAASPDLVRGDGYQLEQVLLNLILNAVEAMGPNGTLSLRTEISSPDPSSGDAPARKILLHISDTGSGIPPENISRLFEPFFTTKKKGNGLGLSITRRIIQEHRGSIEVQSALNEGTTFTVTLPSN